MTYDPSGAVGDGDTSNATQGCMAAGCHDAFNLNTWAGIVSEHDVATNGAGACATCHNSGRSAGVNTPYTSIIDVIQTGTSVTCDSCHDDKTPNASHGGHSSGHFGGDAQCTACHTIPGTGVVEGIHNNDCDLCHTTGGPYNAGTNKVGANGDGDAGPSSGAEGDAGTWSSTCLTCHPTGTYPPDVVHHTNDGSVAYTVNNNCTYCHSDPRGSAPFADAATPPTNLYCLTCHGTASAIHSNTPVTSGTDYTTVSTTVVHSLPAAVTTVDNFGICFSCHDNDLTDTAPTVTVLHAKPSWTAGSNDPLRGAALSDTGTCDTGLATGGHPGVFTFGFFVSDYDALDGGEKPYKNTYQNDGMPKCWEGALPPTQYSGATFTVPSVPGNGSTSGTVPVP